MADAADRANQLAAAGQARQGRDLLDRACAEDDVRALFERALWHLKGIAGPRDLARAYRLFDRAHRVGHVNAAMLLVAMTANGTGTPQDWAKARSLLALAATTDPVAAHHLALLSAMGLGLDGSPQSTPTGAPLSSRLRAIRFPQFLTAAECAHLANTANPNLAPALVIDERSGRQVPNPVRTSHAAALGPMQEDLVVRAINLRIASASATQVEKGEPLMVMRYTPGQEYRMHSDALPATTANQRSATMLIYLNDGYVGGETVFPALDLTIRGRAGDAVLFDNLGVDGRANEAARHAGLPVTAGVKWLATRWIRQAPVDPWTMA